MVKKDNYFNVQQNRIVCLLKIFLTSQWDYWIWWSELFFLGYVEWIATIVALSFRNISGEYLIDFHFLTSAFQSWIFSKFGCNKTEKFNNSAYYLLQIGTYNNYIGIDK
jgi:hypothetical protein